MSVSRILGLLALAALIASPHAASAQSKIFWTEFTPEAVRSADANGGNVSTLATSSRDPVHIDYDPLDGALYWSDARKEIWRTAVATGATVQITDIESDQDFGAPSGLAYNPNDGGVYWTDSSEGKLWRQYGAGAPQLVLSGLTDPGVLELDESNNTLYWVDQAGRVQRSSTGGGVVTTLVSGETSGPQVMSGIALDVAGGKLYWAIHGVGIRWANLDGSNKATLLPRATIGNPNDLVFDPVGDRLVWAELNSKIMTSGPDGSSPQTLISGLGAPIAVTLGPVQHLIFSDGFESGDTSAWSATVTP